MNATNIVIAILVIFSALSGVAVGKDGKWDKQVAQSCDAQAELLFPAARDSMKREAAVAKCESAYNAPWALKIAKQ